MSDRNKNEICLELWKVQKHYKEAGFVPVKWLVETFKEEMRVGLRLETKYAAAVAATSTLLISAMQSLVLKAKGVLLDKQNLQFKESDDQLLKSMAGSIVLEATKTEDGRIRILKTDGESEFELFAENPRDDQKVGDLIWVLEPFVVGQDGVGKAWCEMSADERSKAGESIRSASQMPKSMQKRRVSIKEIRINHDDRTAWLEFCYQEAEPFGKEKFEEDHREEIMKRMEAELEMDDAEEKKVDEGVSLEEVGEPEELHEEAPEVVIEEGVAEE
jgi:hypothetical protein